MNCLFNVTYGCIVMTYGASQRRRKSRTSQSCTRFAAAVRFTAGGRREDGSRLLSVSTSSLPVSPTSRTIETGCSCHGCEDSFHGEAVRSVGRASAFIRQHERDISQRDREPCAGGASARKDEAWVNDHQVVATRFSWNIGLIVC